MADNNLNLSNMPQSLEAEQSILGCILLDPNKQFTIVSQLEPEDFYYTSHQYIFQCIQEIVIKNETVDEVGVADLLARKRKQSSKKNVTITNLSKLLQEKTLLEEIGGVSFLTDLTFKTPSAENYENYLSIVKRNSILRKLIKSCDRIINEAKMTSDSNGVLQKAEKAVYTLSQTLDRSVLSNVREHTKDVIDLYTNIQTDKHFLQGLYSGYTKLDSMTGGFKKGNLIILAARPSVGKTTLAMNIVSNVAVDYSEFIEGYKDKNVVAVFALEMTKDELAQRLICSVANVSNLAAREARLNDKDWGNIHKAKKRIDESEIYIDDTASTTVTEILSKCRRLKSEKGRIDLIVIDHIQLMNVAGSSSAENRQSQITEISRGLKMMAKELSCPVLALSQLNRDSTKENRKPKLSDIRESGAIEQDADMIMFIHRPGMGGPVDENTKDKPLYENQKDDGDTEILVEKNRSGPTGTFRLKFLGEQNKFINPRFNPPDPTQYGLKDSIDKLSESIPPEEEPVENIEINEPDFEDPVFNEDYGN